MVGLEMTYTDEEFNKIYNTVVDELRGNLTPEEYKELITIEYVLTWKYCEPGDEERYKELRIKKNKKL